MQTDSISVIIPTHNCDVAQLERLAHSIQAQTVKPDEIIVCDDGSKDDTPVVAKALFPDARHFANETNVGVYKTTERMVNLAESEYVLRVDSDDAITPHFIESAKKTIQEYPYDYISFRRVSVDSRGLPLQIQRTEQCSDYKDIPHALDVFFSKQCPWYVTGKVVKTSIWRASFDPTIPEKIILDDVFIAMRQHALSSSYRCPNVDDTYIYYFGTGYWSSPQPRTLQRFIDHVKMRYLLWKSNSGFLYAHGLQKYIPQLYAKSDVNTLWNMLKRLPDESFAMGVEYLSAFFELSPKDGG